MERFTERTRREEIESLPTCWECGDACAELTQAPWTAQRMLVGACCLPPVEEQFWNAMTPAELAALDAQELAIFGPRKEAARAVRYSESEVA